MKIYTKTGDGGETALYGGERIAKDSLRVNAYGAVDEANASLGCAITQLSDEEIKNDLTYIQSVLFDLGADLATRTDSSYRKQLRPIDEADVTALERLIDSYDAKLEPLKHFILPGGHPAAAALHLARTITRRAEREVIRLASQESLNPHTMIYLNRLSDLLFTLARVVNQRAGITETVWQARNQT